ncbi:MAG: alpha/beta hydrolase family protein [Novosphingobium sp.]
MLRNLSVAGLIGAGLASPVHAQSTAPQFDAASAFGAREGVLDIAISPDGKRIAAIVPKPNGGEAVTVLDLGGAANPQLALASRGTDDQILGCNWVGNNRLLCKLWFVDGKAKDTTGATRNIAINPDGSNPKVVGITKSLGAEYRSFYGGNVIDFDGGGENTILMIKEFVPATSTGTILKVDKVGFGVVRVDTVTGKETTVEQPKTSSYRFISGGRGTVRITALQPTDNAGYAGSRIVYRYRPTGSSEWRDLSTVIRNPSGTRSGFEPYAVDPATNTAYGFQDNNGFSALFKVPLDGSSLTPVLVAAKPGIDVDELVRVGRDQRVVGVSYGTDYRTADYSDPELAKLSTALHKALPGKSQIDFVDATQDESKLVLRVGSDTDPGTYYLFDKKTKQLGELLPLRPALKGVKLGEMRPVRFAAADGTSIPAYLTLPPGSDGKNLPTIVMPHGGPEARDEWGFDWFSQFFAMRGYAVIQPQYRGSTGFGSAFFGTNAFQSWRQAIGDIDDAARWAIKQGIANPDKLAIVGWSYGGYAALQAQVVDPGLYKAVVAVAPVTDFEVWRDESLDTADYRLQSARIGTGPHVAEGSPARHADAFRAPVLLFHGDRDTNVGVGESRLMVDRLKQAGKAVDYVEFPGLDHYLDNSEARTRLLAQSDAFLRRTMKMPAN